MRLPFLSSRRTPAMPPEPDGPWAAVDSQFYDGPPLPCSPMIGTPVLTGTQVGQDGRTYAVVCIGTGPDAITSIRTQSAAYASAMAHAWIGAYDVLNPAPAELGGQS